MMAIMLIIMMMMFNALLNNINNINNINNYGGSILEISSFSNYWENVWRDTALAAAELSFFASAFFKFKFKSGPQILAEEACLKFKDGSELSLAKKLSADFAIQEFLLFKST